MSTGFRRLRIWGSGVRISSGAPANPDKYVRSLLSHFAAESRIRERKGHNLPKSARRVPKNPRSSSPPVRAAIRHSRTPSFAKLENGGFRDSRSVMPPHAEVQTALSEYQQRRTSERAAPFHATSKFSQRADALFRETLGPVRCSPSGKHELI